MMLSFKIVWLMAVLGIAPAEEKTYVGVGQTLTLEPKKSALPESISSIRWKFGSRLVADWNDDGWFYYGPYQNRATLENVTLRLEIPRLALNDTGVFSLETNNGPVGTFHVQVLKPPPKPKIKTQPLACNQRCALNCTADVNDDHGPVTYEWRKNAKEWSPGDQVKQLRVPDEPEKFYCRLKTPLQLSEESSAIENPLKKTPEATVSHTPVGVIVLAVMAPLIAAFFAVVGMVVLYPNHRWSKQIRTSGIYNWMKNTLCPTPVTPVNQHDVTYTSANRSQSDNDVEMQDNPGPVPIYADVDTRANQGQSDNDVEKQDNPGPVTIYADVDTRANQGQSGNDVEKQDNPGPEKPILPQNNNDHPNGQVQPENLGISQ